MEEFRRMPESAVCARIRVAISKRIPAGSLKPVDGTRIAPGIRFIIVEKKSLRI